MDSPLPVKEPVELKKPDKIKKPYTTPKLVVYGDIHVLTRASGSFRVTVDSMAATKTA